MSKKAMKQMLEALESYYGYMEPLTTVFGGPRVPAEQSTTGKVEKAITAGRQAIEQAEKQEQGEPVAWLYPEGLEALQRGKCWTAYGTKQDDDCNIPVYLNAAVAPKVEPAKAECGGFDSHPAAPVQEPVQVDRSTMELAESVGLIGPASRTHDLHNAIQRFHDLICANATIKAAVAFSHTLEAKDEPVAWATREDFYRELEHAMNRMRQQMEIKSVTMRCTDYDLALPVIDIFDGRILVGQVTTPPQRTWVGLTDEERIDIAYDAKRDEVVAVKLTEAKLRSKNT